jgi:hypothetical protein
MDSIINYILSVFQEYGWVLLLILAMYRHKRVYAIAAITAVMLCGYNRIILLIIAILCMLSKPDIPTTAILHINEPNNDKNKINPDGEIIAVLPDKTEED